MTAAKLTSKRRLALITCATYQVEVMLQALMRAAAADSEGLSSLLHGMSPRLADLNDAIMNLARDDDAGADDLRVITGRPELAKAMPS